MAHTYIIGKSGTGKSTHLLHLLLQNIDKGHGIFFIDPHGDDADKLLDLIPKHRAKDVILFNPAELTQPINILEDVLPFQRPRIASSMVEAVRNVARYDNTPTPVLNRIIRHSVSALFDTQNTTICDIRRMLLDDKFRSRIVRNTKDAVTKSFWIDEYDPMTDKEKRDFRTSTLNNVDAFLDDPRIRNTIGYPKSIFKMADVLDGKMLIAKLPQGALGIEKTRVLGSLLIAMFHAAALSRPTREPFHVAIDECHHFGTGSLIEMLSGIRKFGVNIILSHQYLDQLSDDFRHAILGNAGIKTVFQIGIPDALLLENEFEFNNTLRGLHELEPGVARITSPNSKPQQIPMPTLPQRTSYREEIERFNRRHYTRTRRKVEGWISST